MSRTIEVDGCEHVYVTAFCGPARVALVRVDRGPHDEMVLTRKEAIGIARAILELCEDEGGESRE